MPTQFGRAEAGWVILSSAEARLKAKIEEAGTPLKDWDVQINYGIKTGFNEAFIIDGATREKLINQSPESAEIIRPLLRGQDIKRYVNKFADLWLLFIPWHFPMHDDLSIVGNSSVAEAKFQKDYPVVYQHLLQYKTSLTNRNQAETGIRYEWYAMQRFGANYLQDFQKDKIIWGNLNKEANFSVDYAGSYIIAPCNMMTSSNDDLDYLIAVLNSPITTYFMKNQGYSREGGYVEYKRIFVEQLPVPVPSHAIVDSIRPMIQQINKDPRRDTKNLENEINMTVFRLYNFNSDEINSINSLIRRI